VMPDTRTCFYYYRDLGCGPGDISARLSFMKVPERDFEAREYPDRIQLVDDDGAPIRTVSGSPVGLPVMDEFGFFRTERAQYEQIELPDRRKRRPRHTRRERQPEQEQQPAAAPPGPQDEGEHRDADDRHLIDTEGCAVHHGAPT
jgi:hypothetical protein